MGKNIGSYDPDPSLDGTERLIGTDENGETKTYSVNSLAAYAQTDGTGRMAIFDAATLAVPYSEVKSDVSAIDLPARLEFTGPRNDTQFFPEKYGVVVKNINSAPESSNFDFRFLPKGLFIEFDVEFKASLADDSGFRIDREYAFNFEVTYPNGDVEKQTITIPNEYIVTTIANAFGFKLTFSTYIKDVLTDSLVGGSMKFISYNNPLSATEFITITDLIVRARI